MNAKKARPTRLSAEESRNQILAASLKILSQLGWDGISFQKIGNACGVSQSAVLYHFKSREHLLEALLGKISANNFRIVDETLRPNFDAFKRLETYIERNLEWAMAFPEEAQVIILVYYRATHDLHFAKIFKSILDRAQGRVLELVLAGIREKIFKPEISPETLCKVIHNTLIGAFINLMAGRQTGVKNYKASEWRQIIGALTGHNL